MGLEVWTKPAKFDSEDGPYHAACYQISSTRCQKLEKIKYKGSEINFKPGLKYLDATPSNHCSGCEQFGLGGHGCFSHITKLIKTGNSCFGPTMQSTEIHFSHTTRVFFLVSVSFLPLLGEDRELGSSAKAEAH